MKLSKYGFTRIKFSSICLTQPPKILADGLSAVIGNPVPFKLIQMNESHQLDDQRQSENLPIIS